MISPAARADDATKVSTTGKDVKETLNSPNEDTKMVPYVTFVLEVALCLTKKPQQMARGGAEVDFAPLFHPVEGLAQDLPVLKPFKLLHRSGVDRCFPGILGRFTDFVKNAK